MYERIKELLSGVRSRRITVEKALEKLRSLPYEDIGIATLDTHRGLRMGFPEVIFGQDKSAEHIITIIKKMKGHKSTVLVTRVDEAKGIKVKRAIRGVKYHPLSRTLLLRTSHVIKRGKGKILIVSAGTSDLNIAEEARITAETMGNDVETLYDVGVAGIHRVLMERDRLLSARVIIVVAGMEGALASVVGGLVPRPIIAVPTSVGYGSSLGGFSALLSMLNSCAPGVTVVNIDNGFGAACAASFINMI